MNALTINVVGLPAPQGSKKGFYNPRIGRVQMVESSKKVKPWRTDVQVAALAAIGEGWTPLVGPVELAITFFMPRPAAHYRTGAHAGVLKPTAPVLVDKRPDCSKLIRSTEDALTEAGVYRDDAQVARLVAEKRYADAATGARITITPLPTTPVSVPVTAPPYVAGTDLSSDAPLQGEGAGRPTTQPEGALW